MEVGGGGVGKARAVGALEPRQYAALVRRFGGGRRHGRIVPAIVAGMIAFIRSSFWMPPMEVAVVLGQQGVELGIAGMRRGAGRAHGSRTLGDEERTAGQRRPLQQLASVHEGEWGRQRRSG